MEPVDRRIVEGAVPLAAVPAEPPVSLDNAAVRRTLGAGRYSRWELSDDVEQVELAAEFAAWRQQFEDTVQVGPLWQVRQLLDAAQDTVPYLYGLTSDDGASLETGADVPASLCDTVAVELEELDRVRGQLPGSVWSLATPDGSLRSELVVDDTAVLARTPEVTVVLDPSDGLYLDTADGSVPVEGWDLRQDGVNVHTGGETLAVDDRAGALLVSLFAQPEVQVTRTADAERYRAVIAALRAGVDRASSVRQALWLAAVTPPTLGLLAQA